MIGGLVVATALTLIVVPVVYSVVESGHARLRGRARAPRPARAAEVIP